MDEDGRRPEYYDGIGWKIEEREMEVKRFFRSYFSSK